MRKKILSLALASVLCVLCACSGNSADGVEEEADTTAAQSQETINTEAPVPDAPEDEQIDSVSNAAHLEMTLTEEERHYWESEYAAVLNQYYEALSEDWDEYKYEDTFVNTYCLYETLDSVGYTFIDLDSDGTYELLVGLPAEQEYNGCDGLFLSLYRQDDDNQIIETSATQNTDDWEAYAFLCTENKVKSEVNWFTGEETHTVVDWPQNEVRQVLFKQDYADAGYDSPWLYKEFERTIDSMEQIEMRFSPISETEAQDFLRDYDALEGVYVDYMPLSEYTLTDLPIDDAGHLYKSDDDIWIKDDDGNVIASLAAGDFDSLLGFGDGYYLLLRDLSTFDEISYELGIIKYDGTWAREYAPSAGAEDRAEDWLGHPYYMANDMAKATYLGKGLFTYYANVWNSLAAGEKGITADMYIIPCSNEEEYMIPDIIIQGGYGDGYLNGYSVYTAYLVEALENADYVHLKQTLDGNMLIINMLTGEILVDLGDGIRLSRIGEYSDGGFVYMEADQLYFFDCSTRESAVISLEDADKFAGCSYQFVDGEMEIQLNGADGNTYYATVDKNGNYITEPHLAN